MVKELLKNTDYVDPELLRVPYILGFNDLFNILVKHVHTVHIKW